MTEEEKAKLRGGGAGRGNTIYVVEHLEDEMGECVPWPCVTTF